MINYLVKILSFILFVLVSCQTEKEVDSCQWIFSEIEPYYATNYNELIELGFERQYGFESAGYLFTEADTTHMVYSHFVDTSRIVTYMISINQVSGAVFDRFSDFYTSKFKSDKIRTDYVKLYGETDQCTYGISYKADENRLLLSKSVKW